MANNKSAIKRIRQVSKRHLRNRQVLGSMRSALKSARTAIDAGDKNAGELIKTASSFVDRAVGKGVIKRNAGSRLISRLARRGA